MILFSVLTRALSPHHSWTQSAPLLICWVFKLLVKYRARLCLQLSSSTIIGLRQSSSRVDFSYFSPKILLRKKKERVALQVPVLLHQESLQLLNRKFLLHRYMI